MAYTQEQPMGGSQDQQPKYTPLAPPGDLSPGNINATAPQPYGAFGNIPTLDPTYWMAQGYNPYGYNAYQANPFEQQQYLSQYDTLLQKGLSPFFKNQQLAEQQQLAQTGITDSSASAYDIGNLKAQQAGILAQQEAPMVQQAFGYTQQDVMANQAAINQARQYYASAENQAAQFGAQAQNEANASNAAASNQANAQNAQYYSNAVNENAGMYNQYMQMLYGSGSQEQQALMAAYLNSFGPNTGVENAFGTGMSGVMNAYTDLYGNAMQGQNQTMGGLGMAAGMFAPWLMGGMGGGGGFQNPFDASSNTPFF